MLFDLLANLINDTTFLLTTPFSSKVININHIKYITFVMKKIVINLGLLLSDNCFVVKLSKLGIRK